MKAYGIPRIKDTEWPDVADIQNYGMPSHVGKYPSKSGDYKSYTRSATKRQTTRRRFKRIERMAAKQQIFITTKEVE